MIEEQSYKRTQRLYLSEQVQGKAGALLGASWLLLRQLLPGAVEMPEGLRKMCTTEAACMGSKVLNTLHWEEVVCA